MALIRKISAILLLLCFVLPLSKCTTTKTTETGKAVVADEYQIGYKVVQKGFTQIENGDISTGLIQLLAVVNVFFLPLICLGLREKLQIPIHLIAGISAGYFLFIWVFLTTPLYGGILALACWVMLFSMSIVVLIRCWINRSSSKN